MEHNVRIPLPESDHAIYGIFRDAGPDTPLVLLVHGMSSHNQEHYFYNGARALSEAGLSSYRLKLYGMEPDARDMVDSTLAGQVADLTAVFAYWRERFADRPMMAVGHSYGGLVVLGANLDLTAAVLWDPAHSSVLPIGRHSDAPEAYQLQPAAADAVFSRKGYGRVMGHAMMAESHQIDSDALLRQFNAPVRVISAGKRSMGASWAESIEAVRAIKPNVDHVIIEAAGHTFHEGDTAQELYRDTIDWLKRSV